MLRLALFSNFEHLRVFFLIAFVPVTRAVVETDLSETKTETETAKFFRDQERDQDRSRSQFWLRDRDRQSSRPRPRPRPQNDVINNFFDFLKKSFWSSYLLMSWFYDYIN